MILLLLAVAFAAPDVVVPRPGVVAGTVRLAAPPGVVRAAVADPRRVAAIAGDTVTVVPTGSEGPCLLADYTAPSALRTVRYSIRQCPTTDGVAATLVRSDDLTAYEARWSVVPDGAGSLVTYQLSLSLRVPLPAMIVTAITRDSVGDMLEAFATEFGER